jgi:hypothetical protein
MKITVTKNDIEGGRKSDPEDCPVARALRRAGILHFGVTGMAVMVQGEREHATILLPSGVQEWIMEFDWGTQVEPMHFELALPPEQCPGRERKGRRDITERQPRPGPASVPEPSLLPPLWTEKVRGATLMVG